MGAITSINWTSSSVNPLLARLLAETEIEGHKEPLPAGKLGYHCVKVDDSCAGCYAETFNQRGLPERGTGLPYAAHSGRKVEMVLHRPALDQFLRWGPKKDGPRKVFWCSMTDLFGEFVPSAMIQECLDVAVQGAETKGHISQILTKRTGRMVAEAGIWKERHGRPLPPQVWLGFSAGDRKLFWPRWQEARELVAQELALGPVWCSYEPSIGRLVWPDGPPSRTGTASPGSELERSMWRICRENGLRFCVWGGESGAKARPFDLQWGRDVNEFLGSAGISVWAKQVGRRPVDGGVPLKLKDKKGADAAEWPAGLLKREFLQ